MTSQDEEEVGPGKRKKFLLHCRDFLYTYVPITEWLPKYKWKEYFVGDLIAGLTIGCLHISQGMSFAMLAHVDPIMGLYTSCFPVFIYCIFGTAIISSFGTVSITSMLVGDAIEYKDNEQFTLEDLAEVITFIVGIVYLVCFIVHYDVVTKLFTRYLTSSFIMACALQVIMRSLKMVLGIEIKDVVGYFSFIYNTYNLCKEIPHTNLITFAISVSILIIFIVNTYAIVPCMKKRTKYILPVELITLVLVTLMSYYLKFDQFNVSLVGPVPTGLPTFSLPKVEASEYIWTSSLLIACINLTTSLAIVTMFNPNISIRQELFALSMSNLLCCPFHTIPFGNSMTRSVIARSCGINTLLATVISSILVLMAILFLGPLFSPIPLCALGCIIVYGLSLLLVVKVKEVPEMFKAGVENALIWVITGTVSLFIAIELGLIVGLLLTLRQYLANPNWEDKKTEETVVSDTGKQQQQPSGRKL